MNCVNDERWMRSVMALPRSVTPLDSERVYPTMTSSPWRRRRRVVPAMIRLESLLRRWWAPTSSAGSLTDDTARGSSRGRAFYDEALQQFQASAR
jgi:hypothetical protein